MSELRLYPRRDGPLDGVGCAWALLGPDGRTAGAGTGLDSLPAARHCRLVLPSDRVLMLDADLPDLPPRRLAAMLPAAAEAATLEDAEQLHVVPAGPRIDGRIPLAVVNRAWLGRILEPLRGRGLHPDEARPECMLLPWTEGEWSILLDEDGVAVRFDRHRGAALDQGDPPAGLRLALSRGPAPRRIRLYQGSALNTPDLARWEEKLGIPVQAAGSWDWREAVWDDGVNLLAGEFAAARGRLDWRALIRPLAGSLALLAGLQLAGMTLDWAAQSREQARIRAEMRELAAKALPAHAAVVDPAWQVSERLRALRAGAGGGSPDGLLALVARLGQAWPPGGGPVPRTVSYGGKQLELGFAAAEPPWLRQLESAGAARGLSITTAGGEAGGILVRVRAIPGGTGPGVTP